MLFQKLELTDKFENCECPSHKKDRKYNSGAKKELFGPSARTIKRGLAPKCRAQTGSFLLEQYDNNKQYGNGYMQAQEHVSHYFTRLACSTREVKDLR